MTRLPSSFSPGIAEPSRAEYRVNARLGRSHATKLEYLTAKHSLSVSEVVKVSIDQLYEATRSREKRPYDIMRETGLIGCGDGPVDLSSRYKEYLTEEMNAKYPKASKRGQSARRLPRSQK